MAKGVNKVFLLGRLWQRPRNEGHAGRHDHRQLHPGNIGPHKGCQGNWPDNTEWHNLVAFQRTAEIVRDYCKKGSQLFVEGKIQTRSWEDKEPAIRSTAPRFWSTN